MFMPLGRDAERGIGEVSTWWRGFGQGRTKTGRTPAGLFTAGKITVSATVQCDFRLMQSKVVSTTRTRVESAPRVNEVELQNEAENPVHE